MDGRQVLGEAKPSRNGLDWLLVVAATSVFRHLCGNGPSPKDDVALGTSRPFDCGPVVVPRYCGLALWRTTRFH